LSGKQWDYTGRVEKKKSGDFNVNEKVHFWQDKLHIWANVKFNINKVKLHRYNALVAYKEKDFDVVLQHESKVADELGLGAVHLGAYYRHGKYQAGLKGTFTHWETENLKKFQATVGGIASIDDKNTAKAKIDQNANLSVSLKHKCSKNLTASVSTGINLKDAHSFVKETTIPVPIGVQLEFAFWENKQIINNLVLWMTLVQ